MSPAAPTRQRLADASLQAYGRVDVWSTTRRPVGDDILTTDEATWDRIVAIVLKSVFLCTRAVLPGMIERKRGAIVNISSVNGLMGIGDEAYSAAKAGVINLTRNLAIRYGQAGVRANAICPGTVECRSGPPARRSSPTSSSGSAAGIRSPSGNPKTSPRPLLPRLGRGLLRQRRRPDRRRRSHRRHVPLLARSAGRVTFRVRGDTVP